MSFFVRLQHGEGPAVQGKTFARGGHMPGFHAQVAADGVHLVRVQVYAHVLQIFKQGAAVSS